jgi:hypothetical protein
MSDSNKLQFIKDNRVTLARLFKEYIFEFVDVCKQYELNHPEINKAHDIRYIQNYEQFCDTIYEMEKIDFEHNLETVTKWDNFK